MKTFLSKYLFPLAALAALIAYLLCRFEEKRCADPITTYEVRPDGLLIEPDSTIAGVTQIKIKVTTLDSLGATLLDTTIAPGQRVVSPPPAQNTTIRVAQDYQAAGGASVLRENENINLQGGIITADVVIRPITGESDPYYNYWSQCCSLDISENGASPFAEGNNLLPGYAYSTNWSVPLGHLKTMKVKIISGTDPPVTFVVLYENNGSSNPNILVAICEGSGTFSTCTDGMTALFHTPINNFEFSIQFFKITSPEGLKVEIILKNGGSAYFYHCTEVG